jgi:phenylalanyl-tRNA synthetase beta chain
VDITNYVMLETGQPMHAFDMGKIANQKSKIKIGVRVAQNGEKLVLLDEAEIELNTDDVVIVDSDDNPIALAGVMGGLTSGVNEKTSQILLEVASFDATTIRATRSKHNLTSEAAYRFERDIDPNLVQLARARAVELIAQICGGAVSKNAQYYPTPVTPWIVEVSINYIGKLLGVQIQTAQIVEILELLDIEVAQNDDALICEIPTVRRDLRTPEDIIEEIGRVYGYDNIAPKPLIGEIMTPEQNELRNFEYVLRNFLSGIGADEVKGYSFYAREAAEALGLDADAHVSLANPMNPNQALMRRTLTAHLLEAARTNLTHSTDCAIYEVGKTYIPQSKDALTDDNLPQEHLVLALAVAGKEVDGTQFYALKGMVEQLLTRVGLQDYRIVPQPTTEGFDGVDYHPSRRAIIMLPNDEIIGVIGEATKKQLKYFGIKKARVATVEIDIEALRKSALSDRFFIPISKFPAVMRDLSMIVPARLPVADVERVLYDSARRAGDLVKDIDLFDLYINPENEERSMAFRITLAHPERTLTSAEIDTAITTMIDAVQNELGVSVRTS